MRRFVGTAAVAATVLTGLVAAPAAQAATVPCSASSLISAIKTANGTTGGATITLTSGCVYTLTVVNNTTDGGDRKSVV